MLRYHTITVTDFQQNCSIIWCDQTQYGAVIDPGGNVPAILQFAQQQKIMLKKILLTHAHVDHCAGVYTLTKQCDVTIVGPNEADDYWIASLPHVAQSYGFPPTKSFAPSRWLNEGDTVQVGNETMQVHHCPGHSPGHVVFFAPQIQTAFVGDVLFAGSIGRTDLPGGNQADLIQSVQQKLWPMGDDIVFIPGHGSTGTLGHERQHNPFVGAAAQQGIF